jgi:phosphatidylglycerophosphate synthase
MSATSPASPALLLPTPACPAPAGPSGVPVGWKIRLEDPFNRYYRYPLARHLVRVLMKTPVTPNQVTLVQPFLAAIAGYCVTFDDARHLALGALLFEIRSILDCADGTLARAKNMMSPAGHAIDAMADWIGVIFLYAGIVQHFRLHPAPDGPWSPYISTTGILCVVLFHAALRSFASDYYKLKYTSIFEQGRDETVASLRRKVLALGARPSLFARIDVFIGEVGHLFFERERFDLASSRGSVDEAQVQQLLREEGSPKARLIGGLWALSNGDAFLSLVVISLLVNQLWLGQLLFATVGVAWIYGVLVINALFLRGASKRARQSPATA